MRWRGERESENVEDRRGEGGGGFGFPMPGGGGMRFPGGGGARGGGIGILGILIILGLMFFFGVDPRVIMQGGPPGGDEQGFPDIRLPQQRPDTTNFPVPRQPQGPDIQHPRSASEDDLRQFVGVVLAETEDVWRNLFELFRSEARAVLRRRSFRLRHRHGADGPVLLSDGREGLYRPFLL